jgi:hypothetical protein
MNSYGAMDGMGYLVPIRLPGRRRGTLREEASRAVEGVANTTFSGMVCDISIDLRRAHVAVFQRFPAPVSASRFWEPIVIALEEGRGYVAPIVCRKSRRARTRRRHPFG